MTLIFFSEWSNLDVAWTSAFSLIVVTSVLGNVMVIGIFFHFFLGWRWDIAWHMTYLVCAPQVPYGGSFVQMLWTACAHRRMWSVMTLAWHTTAGSFDMPRF